jgi:PPOX class probable F420-dependent enzyme
MDLDRARELVGTARVARLATTNAAGQVDLVPITFAVVGDRLVTAVDHKPKTSDRLRRLDNIEAHPEVTVLVDHYADAWAQLWWVRLRGRARVWSEGPDDLMAALVDRYRQYQDRPPTGSVIEVAIEDWSAWSYRPTP